jgi:Bacterial Ig-like domain (group 3)/Glycosyl hydrolase family 26
MFRLSHRSGISRIVFVFSILAATVLTSVGVTAASGAGATAGSSSPLGVYVGYQSPGGVSSFGRAIGQQPTFAMDFLNGSSWSALVNTAPSYMSAWKGSGYTMVWGLPMLPNSGSTLAQGAAGSYNSYFLQLAQEMVAGGQGSSIIRPGWEFNGGWFSWAANGQAAAFVAFWQQIVNTMRSVPGQSFTFEWNPTAGDTGVGNLANYYPGNAYVDDVGLDLYDQSWGTYNGIASQWNTDLTEPYGLNWLASFAASQGKQIVLPEWGLDPSPSSNDGGVTSAGNSEVGGGDDPTFINDMAQWINQNQVYEANYWQYNSSLLSSRSNPNSFAAFTKDFGSGSGSGTGSGLTGSAPTTSTTTSSSTSTTTSTTTTTSPGSGTGPSGPPSQGDPGSGQGGSTVTIQDPTGPVATWRGAHFSAVVGWGAGGTGPSGSVTWGIRSRFGATIPCHSGNSIIGRHVRTTHCNVSAGVLRAGDGPYTVSVSYPGGSGVAGSSASVTQPVAKGSSRTLLHAPAFVRTGNPVPIKTAVFGLPRSAGTATGTVMFTISVASGSGPAPSCAGGDTVDLVSGLATCDVAAAGSSGSTYTVTAAYSGDSTFSSSNSNTRTITVR